MSASRFYLWLALLALLIFGGGQLLNNWQSLLAGRLPEVERQVAGWFGVEPLSREAAGQPTEVSGLNVGAPSSDALVTAAVPAAPIGAAASDGAPSPSAPEPASDLPAVAQPTFDAALLSSTGSSVLSGRAAPGSNVTVMANGVALGEATADETGAWVIADGKTVPAGNYSLSVVTQPKGSAVQTVTDDVIEVTVGDIGTANAAVPPPSHQQAGVADAATGAALAEATVPAADEAAGPPQQSADAGAAAAIGSETATAAAVGDEATGPATQAESAPVADPAPSNIEVAPSPTAIAAATDGAAAPQAAAESPGATGVGAVTTPATLASSAEASAGDPGTSAAASSEAPAGAQTSTGAAPAAVADAASATATVEPRGSVTATDSGATPVDGGDATVRMAEGAGSAAGEEAASEDIPVTDGLVERAGGVAGAVETFVNGLFGLGDGSSGDEPGAADVVISSITYLPGADPSASGRLIASGRAVPGSELRILVDDNDLGVTRADDNGRWLREVEAQVAAGERTFAVELLKPDGAVSAKVEKSFTAPLPADGLVAAASPPSAGKDSSSELTISTVDYEAMGSDKGVVVVTGTAPAGSKLRVSVDDTDIGGTESGLTGLFALETDFWIGPGAHRIEVAVIGAEGDAIATTSMTFERKPDSAGDGLAAAAPSKTGALAVSVVAYEAMGKDKGVVTIEGTAPPGAQLRATVDDIDIGGLTAGATGTYRLETDFWLSPGPHRIEVAEIGAEGNAVATARSEFVRKTAPAVASTAVKTGKGKRVASKSRKPDKKRLAERKTRVAKHTVDLRTRIITIYRGDEVIRVRVPRRALRQSLLPGQLPRWYRVRRGDTLWGIAKSRYGFGPLYALIAAENQSRIGNPDRIVPRQRILLPALT